MTQSDDLATIIALEAQLAKVSRAIAGVLSEPPSGPRGDKVRMLWRQIDGERIKYRDAVQALRANVMSARQDSPMQAATRRKLVQHGPARASLWDQMTALVGRQLLASSFPPLVTERSEMVRGPEFGAVNYLMQMLFQLSNPIASDKSQVPDTHYRDIPLSGAYFLNLLTAARRLLLAQNNDGPVRFLDMGCGGGSKVLAASAVFDVAHGVEYSPDYVTEAHGFLQRVGADPAVIRQGDALGFDDYGNYDVVYFYRPLKTPAAAARMEERVIAQVKPGTIILAPLNVSLGRKDNGAMRVDDKIYLAHKTRQEVTDIVDRACNIGVETRIVPHQDADMLGFWEPIVSQSRRNGFALN